MLFTLPAEFIANDKPFLVDYKGHLYFPVLCDYPESTFGGFLAVTDYRSPFIRDEIKKNGWMIWPLIEYSYRTINRDPSSPAPSPPSKENWLGTDNQSRDVLARVIYGFRVSVLFGMILSVLSSAVGVAAGAIQGYFGGWIDLTFQRFIEIWRGLPQLYVLIIIASVIQPSFWSLLGILFLFQWMTLTQLVRAEFLRARNFDYIRAARAMGIDNVTIMWRHVLAQRDGGDSDVPAFRANRIDYRPYDARLPRLRLAAGLGVSGRAAEPGPQQSAGAVAWPHRVCGACDHAHPHDFHRRSRARRIRSEKDRHMSDPFLDVRRSQRRLPHAGRRCARPCAASRFEIRKGETLALVGESGSGKSATALSIPQLLPYPIASHPCGSVTFEDTELVGASPGRSAQALRGNRISMIFQEPMTSLNPLHTIEKQVNEVMLVHHGLTKEAARAKTLEPACAGRSARCRSASAGLSASAFRWSTPARDDRHGACQ